MREALEDFYIKHIGLSKGSLSLVLIISRNAQGLTFPLKKDQFITSKAGQVAGLGGGAVKKILNDHGIVRILSNEGGRTSRGNMERMYAYVDLLNELYEAEKLDLKKVELFWVEKVRDYFNSKPFYFRLDSARSLRACFRDLFAQAAERQRESSGTMYVGAVMQHLVGAKLEHLSPGTIEHNGFAVADAPLARAGDFLLGDVAIHVTTVPGEALLRKCRDNLASGLKALIVTMEDGAGGARAAAKQFGIEDRVDIIEIEQFLTTNVYEWSSFSATERRDVVSQVIDGYNSIVDSCETDPSLRILLQ